MSAPHAAPPAGAKARPPFSRRALYFLVFGLAVAGIFGLTALLVYNDVVARFAAPRRESSPVAGGVSLRPFVSITEERAFPVGMAEAPDGTLYLGLFGTGAIKRAAADGTLENWRQVTASGAMAFGPDGALYVVDYSGPDWRAFGQLKRIAPDGTAALFGAALNTGKLPLLAQLAFDSGGNLYVTHPDSGEIWRVAQDGSASVWWSMPPVGQLSAQPIGIAHDPAHNALIVADAGTGTLYRAGLGGSSPLGEPLYRQAGLDVRAVALDDQGRVLVTIWEHDNGILARLESDGALTRLAENFRAPSALVYRAGQVYVVNSDLPGLISQITADPPFTVDVVSLDNAAP